MNSIKNLKMKFKINTSNNKIIKNNHNNNANKRPNINLFLFSLFLIYLISSTKMISKNNIFVETSLIQSKSSKYSTLNLNNNNNNNFSILKNILSNKFVEDCQNYLTCDACLKNSERCGWCYSDGLCKSGNIIGASSSFNFCPFEDWENKKCEKRKCNAYKNQLACITDDNCFWCENTSNNNKNKNIKNNVNSIVIGSCEENENRFYKICKNKYDINDFFRNPNFYKSKNTNDLLNEELKQLSTLEIYNVKNNKNAIDNKSKKTIINNKDDKSNLLKSSLLNNIDINLNNNYSEKGFLKYEEFLKSLKIFMKTNSIKRPPVYDSISNPAGIFDFQNNKLKENMNKETLKNEKLPNYNKDIIPLKNINIDINHLNSTTFDILSQDSKKEIIGISKKIAVEQLIGMFEFTETEPFIKKANKFNMKEYKILEKIASEKWIEFLEKKKIKLSDVRIMIGYYKDDPESGDDITKIVEKHQKLSLLYSFNLSKDQIDSLQSFKTEKWDKIPGASLSFNAYFNSILVIFQKIRLVGNGHIFESLPVSNDEGIKSLISINHKKLSKINLNNFLARKVKKGENKFYVAYKSDFEIFPSEENTIINYAMEFPFINNLQIFKEKFDPIFPKEILLKNIFNYNLKVDIPQSNLDENLLRQNYLLIYKLSNNYLEKNSFMKLNIKNKDTKENLSEEGFASHFVHLPFYAEYKNIFGLTALKLPKGNFEIKAQFKYFLQEFNLEKIKNNNKNINSKFDIYNKTSNVNNITDFNKKLKKEFVIEKNKDKSDKNKKEIIKKDLNTTIIPKQNVVKKEEEKPPVIVNNPEVSEAQEHPVKAPEDKKKHKKKKKKNKKKKKSNNTELSARNGEENLFEDDNFEYEDNEDFIENLDLEEDDNNNEKTHLKKEIINKNNRTAIIFNKNLRTKNPSQDKLNDNEVKANANVNNNKDEDINFENLNKEFLINKIKELYKKLEISKLNNLKQNYLKNINTKYLDNKNKTQNDILEEIIFFENKTNQISNIPEDSDQLEEDKENQELDDTENRLTDDGNSDTENKSKPKKKKKHKKKKNKKKSNHTNSNNNENNHTLPKESDLKNNINNSTTEINNKNNTNNNSTTEINNKNNTNNNKTINNDNNSNKTKNNSTSQNKNIKNHYHKNKKDSKEKIKQVHNSTSLHNPNSNLNSKASSKTNKPTNFNFFPKSDEKSTKNVMKNLNSVLKNIKEKEKDENQNIVKQEFFELNLIRLPISTKIFHKTYKNILYFQANNEFNEIPALNFNLKLKKEKNVLIFINVILTLDYIADFDFKLHINGKDECNSAINSKSKHIINENSINIQRLPAGEYKFEILYNTNKQGAVNLGINEWDIFSMTIVAFDI